MRRLLVLAGVGLVATGLCGCTLLGFGIGKAVDHGQGPKPLAQRDLLTLKLGEPLEVQFWDGTKLTGRFQGLQWTPAGQYERPTRPRGRARPASLVSAGAPCW